MSQKTTRINETRLTRDLSSLASHSNLHVYQHDRNIRKNVLVRQSRSRARVGCLERTLDGLRWSSPLSIMLEREAYGQLTQLLSVFGCVILLASADSTTSRR